MNIPRSRSMLDQSLIESQLGRGKSPSQPLFGLVTQRALSPTRCFDSDHENSFLPYSYFQNGNSVRDNFVQSFRYQIKAKINFEYRAARNHEQNSQLFSSNSQNSTVCGLWSVTFSNIMSYFLGK